MTRTDHSRRTALADARTTWWKPASLPGVWSRTASLADRDRRAAWHRIEKDGEQDAGAFCALRDWQPRGWECRPRSECATGVQQQRSGGAVSTAVLSFPHPSEGRRAVSGTPLTLAVPGTGCPREPDPRLPPRDPAERALLGSGRSRRRARRGARWSLRDPATLPRPDHRSNALARRRRRRPSGSHRRHDSLDGHRRAPGDRRPDEAIPLSRMEGEVPAGRERRGAIDPLRLEVRPDGNVTGGLRPHRRGG